MQIYLSEKEASALINIVEEWCDIMGDGDKESCNRVDKALDNCLGSALYKLYAGRIGQRHYEEYAKKKKKEYDNQ